MQLTFSFTVTNSELINSLLPDIGNERPQTRSQLTACPDWGLDDGKDGLIAAEARSPCLSVFSYTKYYLDHWMAESN
jgi:hypothetical protein